MEVLECKYHLCSIESGLVFRQCLAFLKQVKKLSTWAVLKNKEKFSFILERVVHLDDERMLGLHEDVSLGKYVFLLSLFFNLFFLKDLHCLYLSIIFLLDKDHLGLWTLANDCQQCELIKRNNLIAFLYLHLLNSLLQSVIIFKWDFIKSTTYRSR